MKTKNSKVNKLRRCLTLIAAVLLVVTCLSTTVSAAGVQTVPYDSYTIWSGYDQKVTASQRPAYEYYTSIDGGTLGIGTLSEPNDVCTDSHGNVYIADTGNGRIVVLNPDFTLKSVISNMSYEGQPVDITGALGLFAKDDGTIYIADTLHERVVVCDVNGTVLDLLTLPEVDVIPSDFLYRPKRIAIDSKGYLYVVSEGSYYGALLYGPDGEFSSFYGSNTVASTLGDFFKKLWDKLFSNDVKKSQELKSLPFQFTDIAVDSEDFIFTATGATSIYSTDPGQLKKLSPGGINILKDKTASEVVSSDTLQFSDAAKSVRSESTTNRTSSLASITVSKEGFMYAADTSYGRIYIYDQNCNPISVFGGGVGAAYQKGMTSSISSLALGLDNKVIVLDRVSNGLQVYTITDYGKLLLEAQTMTVAGAYIESKPLWDQVLTLDRNNQLAYRGLAKVALIEKDYETALKYAKIGIDQDTYANAFGFVRASYLTENFTWIFLIIVVLVGGLAALLYISSKKEVKLVRNRHVSMMFRCILHPFEGFTKIRYEGEGSVVLATVVLALFYISSFIQKMYGGFMYQIFDKTSFNSFIVLLGTVGLVLLWVICNWGMATLFEGKGTVKHIYICTCYSLVPITFYNFIYTALSNFVVPDEKLIITVIYAVCFALTAIMFCVSTMTVHEFGFGKFVGITLISVIAMLVVVFIIFMIGILVQQFGTFFITIYKEVKYR